MTTSTIPFAVRPDVQTMPDRVFVYRNLKYKDKVVWSVRDTKTGRVVLHTENILLQDVEFVVGQAGRKRVIEEGRKNVHAGVRGRPVSWVASSQKNWVTYNPYKYESFVDRETEQPVLEASAAYLSGKGVKYW